MWVPPLPFLPHLLLQLGECWIFKKKKTVHTETYCFSVSCSQTIGQLSGRWTDGLVWSCCSAVMRVVNQSIATHAHKHTHACTHRLMTLIQMACLLCVYWPALKGIFYLFFLTKESVPSAQLCIYRFPLLLSWLILNCASQPQFSLFSLAYQSVSLSLYSWIFGSILKSLPSSSPLRSRLFLWLMLRLLCVSFLLY